MSVRQKTRVDVDFSKLSPDEQRAYSAAHAGPSQVSENEHLALEAKKRMDHFRATHVT